MLFKTYSSGREVGLLLGVMGNIKSGFNVPMTLTSTGLDLPLEVLLISLVIEIGIGLFIQGFFTLRSLRDP